MAINASAVWRVRPSGNNLNGGGYDPGISGAATDYSQQNAAQVSGSAGTATGTTTFSDSVANNFTAAMVGNAIQIASGAGFTVGCYFVTAFTNSSTVTLDRSPGTGTVAVWKLGGGWADPITNTTNSVASQIPVGGNIVYILGSGTPNPSSYTFDYNITSALNGGAVNGSATNGVILFANDPQTPGYKAAPDTTGGMPVIETIQEFIIGSNYVNFSGLWFVANAASSTGIINTGGNASAITLIGCVCDQNGNDIPFTFNNACNFFGCEVFSSVTPGSSGSTFAISASNDGPAYVIGCNIHNTVGSGITIGGGNGGIVTSSIVAKCRGVGIMLETGFNILIQGNTVDDNIGNGIELTSQAALAFTPIFNNIISNHTQAGTFGLTVDAGTATQNDALKSLCNYNVFYNNATDVNAINYGPHDTHGGANPYVNSAIENYTLA
jgi:Right handed beta helix region